MRWLFAFIGARLGRATPIQPLSDSAEHWQIGDLAECTNNRCWFLNGQWPSYGPLGGEMRIVTAVKTASHPATNQPIQFLGFASYGRSIYEASFFRKIQPRADESIAADATFLADLTRQPKRVS